MCALSLPNPCRWIFFMKTRRSSSFTKPLAMSYIRPRATGAAPCSMACCTVTVRPRRAFRARALCIVWTKTLQARTMKRRYLAFALGTLARQEGAIDAPLGRHPRNRIQHAVVTGAAGKPARTHYRVLALANKAGPSISAVQCDLETGRTHQIRVHLAHLGHPLIGDPVYGDARARHCAASFTRQALHAVRLELTHPLTGQRCIWSAPLPEDMAMLAQTLGLPPALATLHLSDQTPKTNREVNGL